LKTIRFLAIISAVVFPSISFAQTSGTLATQTSMFWTTAPWVITSGSGTFPDGGGVATLDPVINTILGAAAGTFEEATLTLNAPITLSGITFNGPFHYRINGSATNSLGLTTTGPNIFNVVFPVNASLVSLVFGNSIYAPITGGGAFGLTKTGPGTLALFGVNTYTGGTHINGGTLIINSDASLGATGSGNDIYFDGGILFGREWNTSRNIILGQGGGTFLTSSGATTINGVISGAGSLSMSLAPIQGYANSMKLTNTNIYTGATILNGNGDVLTLSGNGSIANSSRYDLAGTLQLENSATNNRLNDVAAMTMRGATITLAGNTGETAGDVFLADGLNTISVFSPGGSLIFAGFTRQNNSTLNVRGRVYSVASPGTLIGGGGAAGSTTISILPWAWGGSGGSIQNGLVTWEAATGAFRPLDQQTEYTTLAAATPISNVRITSATEVSAPTSLNALVLATSGASALTGTSANPLTIASGAFLYAPDSGISATVSASLNFGTAEGIISNATGGDLVLSGVIAGSGGLTFNALPNGDFRLVGANTYTGQTTLVGGTIRFSGIIANDGTTPGPFGLSTSAIVLRSGEGAFLLAEAPGTIINRDISVQGAEAGQATIGVSPFPGTFGLTLNGNLDLQRSLIFYAGPVVTAAAVINGNITGPGSINLASSWVTLNGNNSYSGGTEISTGTCAAGSDTAFGTGTIYFSYNGKIQSANSTAHTFTNNLSLVATPTFQGTGALTFTGGVNLNGSRTIITTNSQPTTFAGLVANGSLTKSGGGILALNSGTGNSYTGGTVLRDNAGTLNVNNATGSGTGAGTVFIGAGTSTLSGNFTISGATLINGRLQPGNSVGAANFGSNLSFGAAAVSAFEIGSAMSSDKLNVAGLLTLDGSVVVLTINSYVAQLGESFDLIDWGNLNSNGFNVATDLDLTGALTVSGTSWDTSTFLSDGMIRVVPEPSTFMFVIGGLGVLAASMMRRHRARPR
jgi:autotransporter-associated beta strand protein